MYRTYCDTVQWYKSDDLGRSTKNGAPVCFSWGQYYKQIQLLLVRNAKKKFLHVSCQLWWCLFVVLDIVCFHVCSKYRAAEPVFGLQLTHVQYLIEIIVSRCIRRRMPKQDIKNNEKKKKNSCAAVWLVLLCCYVSQVL